MGLVSMRERAELVKGTMPSVVLSVGFPALIAALIASHWQQHHRSDFNPLNPMLFGAGFAVHLLWIAAVVLLVLWVVGFAVGRGESAGSHRFYRW